MIKCEVVQEFTLERFDELKNIQRKSADVKGKLFVGDTFECNEAMAKYLQGDNMLKKTVVKVIEVKPTAEEVELDGKKVYEAIVEQTKINERTQKPKKKKRK